MLHPTDGWTARWIRATVAENRGPSTKASRPRMQGMDRLTRRTLGARIAATAGAAATSYRRVLGANDRIGVGVIGLGNISRGHLAVFSARKDSRVAAVCDIYAPRLDAGVTQTGAKGYRDYRELLADSDVDAVVICTPDHWHAPMAIDAMRAGKDVDVEKPMSLTIAEAASMVRTARETERILAVDSEHMAHGIWEPARQVVEAGFLGKVLWSQTSRSRNTREPPWSYPIDETASPDNLDWEAFLGNAPKRPFSRERFFRWRRYRDYSGGIATDLFYHHVTPLIHVLGREFPARAVSAGGNYGTPESIMEVPDVFAIALDFPSRHTMLCAGSLQNAVELPIVIRGREASIFFEGSQVRPAALRVEPEAPYADGFRDRVGASGLASLGTWTEGTRPVRRLAVAGLSEPRKRQLVATLLSEPSLRERYEEDSRRQPGLRDSGTARDAYFQQLLEERDRRRAVPQVLRIEAPRSPSFREQFLEAIRTRNPAPLDGELGYRSQVAVSLGVEAHRRNKAMAFDAAREEVREL